LEPGLATAFTDAKIIQWKEKKDGQTAFDNLASLETLFKKVYDETGKKIKDDFITHLKTLKKSDGTETEIDTLAKLIAEKEPAEVIKLILKFEYDHLEATKKADQKKKLI
jgi:hypothetical protein